MKQNLLPATQLYTLAQKRHDELYEVQKQLVKNSLHYPDGEIRIVRNKKWLQYYIRENPQQRSGTYLSKKESQKLKAYIQKKYEKEILKLINLEISIITKFLKETNSITDQLKEIYSKNPNEIKKYILPIDMSDNDYANEWLSIPYEGKKITDIDSEFITDKGEHVRSKSELNIANLLYKNKIPYKYECPLVLRNGVVIYPDFTVLNVKKRKVLYWEHRGMMDDRDYSKHTVQRIKEYQKDGYYPGNDLIITEETATCPLGTKDIEATIRNYFFD